MPANASISSLYANGSPSEYGHDGSDNLDSIIYWSLPNEHSSCLITPSLETNFKIQWDLLSQIDRETLLRLTDINIQTSHISSGNSLEGQYGINIYNGMGQRLATLGKVKCIEIHKGVEHLIFDKQSIALGLFNFNESEFHELPNDGKVRSFKEPVLLQFAISEGAIKHQLSSTRSNRSFLTDSNTANTIFDIVRKLEASKFAHPMEGSAEDHRRSEDYAKLLRRLKLQGLCEVKFGIFSFPAEETCFGQDAATLVAVNPYSLAHYKNPGKSKKYNPTEVADYICPIADLLVNHDGPLILFGAEGHVGANLHRLQNRKYPTYFVITNKGSSRSPITEDYETLKFINELGRQVQFVGGYYPGVRPYKDFSVIHGWQESWGCLGGLIKRLEHLSSRSLLMPEFEVKEDLTFC